MDVVDALLLAPEAQRALVAGADLADLARPSRCPGWSVREVINHSVGVTAKFAAFASGTTDHPTTPPGDLLGDRPDRAVRVTADLARSAWTGVDRSRRCHLPFGTFRSEVAAGINRVDVLAHGWDVGPLGTSVFTCPDEVWSLGLTMARLVVGAKRDLRHEAPEVVAPASAPPVVHFLGLVGRDGRSGTTRHPEGGPTLAGWSTTGDWPNGSGI